MTIRDRIALAREQLAYWGDALRAEHRVAVMIEDLKGKIDRTQQVMELVGIISACKQCDEQEGGSCCGAGIENRYGETLLLLNLLMGVELPAEPAHAGSCWFLGERGCVLKARQVICVNYLCPKIDKLLEVEGRELLQHATGEELEAAFITHELLVQCLRRGN